jgi:hypothetical protein
MRFEGYARITESFDKGDSMRSLAKFLSFFLLPLAFFVMVPLFVQSQEQAAFPQMAQPGKRVPIDGDHYLVYGFDKKPKLGTSIMKVEIFGKDGKKDTSFEVKADAGMPSMKGAHETGEKPFALSKKGDYLLPVNVVMPGDWEVRLSVLKGGKVIFRGSYRFDV